jgi:cytochrome c-type biogenesis protein CcmH
MNMVFWAALLSMLLVAIVILVYPLLRTYRIQSIAYRQSNLELYEDKLKELENDLGEGRIDHERYRVARQEVDRELLQDVPVESRETASLHYNARLVRHPGLALVIAVFLPMASLLIYMQLGMHAAGEGNIQVQAQTESTTATEKHPGTQPGTQESIVKMVQALADRVNTNGGTLEEWTMLGRAYKHIGEFAKSASAFEEAVALNGSAQLMLEQAEAMAMLHNRRFTPASRAIVLKALSLEPDNVNALWFAGVAEFQAENYRQSIEHLSRLADVAKGDEEVRKSVVFYISQARDKLAAAGEQVPPMIEFASTDATATGSPMAANAAASNANAGSPKTTTAASGGARVEVHVDVSDAVRSKYQGGDTVFVYAKALHGPKMPLAVQRITLDQLPATVVLDDSMAMMQGMNMSAFGSVMISARLSKSGSAIAQSGDYIGQAEVADVTSAGKLNIVIDSQVP